MQACINKYDRPSTIFYLDPPYWQTEGYGVPFPLKQYQTMVILMRSMHGKAILSINDHPDIRRIFEGFKTRRVELNYTVGGGDKQKKAGELIIRNW